MGAPIALKLIASGHPLSVWGRRPGALQPAIAEGATTVQSPAQLAADCDVVFLCITDTQAVETVVFGPDGIAEGAGKGKILVDHSSIEPHATRDFAERLYAQTGMHWLDAPVSGGVPGVANKTLVVMAGGEQSVFDSVYTLIMDVAGRCTLMGPVGAGQTTKLINQALCGAGFCLIAEVTKLAMDAGIAVEQIPQALAGGRADSSLLQEFMPHMANGDFTPRGRIDIMLKDLETVAQLAQSSKTPMPITGLATALHRILVAQGRGGEDNAAMIRLFDQA
jgi:3-hydroxyisobutyrate dehydrogenase-like beta-hydroxyacid dehydrogenase